MSEKWSLFKEIVLGKKFLKEMPIMGPHLVLILSRSPYLQKLPSKGKILCQFSDLDNKVLVYMYIETGHCRFYDCLA